MEYTNKLIRNILEVIIEQIEKEKQNVTIDCVHNWINDLIDINPDKSITICYCSKCELTKE